jgi:uncharacterized protein (DUF433 family)
MSTVKDNLLVSSPDVCGGLLRIQGTRVTIHQLVTLYKQGYSPEDIADQYPQITTAQVYAALFHYHSHREEVDATLLAEQAESERLEIEYQSTPTPDANTSVHR